MSGLARGCVNGVLIASPSLVNAVFLTTFSRDMFAYLYLVITLLSFFVVKLIAPFIKIHSRGFSLIFPSLCSFACILAYIFFESKNLTLVFIGNVLIMVIGPPLNGAVSNAISRAFDIRTYKLILNKVIIFSQLLTIPIALFTVFLVYYFNTYALVILLVVLNAGISIFLSRLRVVPQEVQPMKNEQATFQYPLFKTIFLFTIVMASVLVLSDYCLKIVAQAHLQRDQIAQFIAAILLMQSLLSAIFVTLGRKAFVHRFGVANLFMIFPFVGVLVSLPVIYSPTFWPVTIAYVTILAVTYSYVQSGRNILVNVLPNRSRFMSRYYLTTVAYTLGVMSTAFLIFWLFHDYMSIRVVFCIVFLFCLGLPMLVMMLERQYVQTLKDSIEQQRFDVRDIKEMNMGKDIRESLALEGLDSDDPLVQQLGIQMLDANPSQAVQRKLLKLLGTSNIETLKVLLTYLYRHPIKQFLSMIIDKLSDVEGQTVRWQLLQVFHEIDEDKALEYAKMHMNTTDPMTISAMASLILHSPKAEPDLVASAKKSLDALLRKGDFESIYWVLHMLQLIHYKEYISEIKSDIHSNDLRLRKEAILAARVNYDDELLTDLVLLPGSDELSVYCENTLRALGDSVIEVLIQRLNEVTNPINVAKRIQILSEIKQISVDQYLITLGSEHSVYIQYCVSNSTAHRALNYSVGSDLKEFAIKKAQQASQLILELDCLLLNQKEPLHRELYARFVMIKEMFFNWLAVATFPREILRSMPKLIYWEETEQNVAVHQKTLEYVDSVISDASLTALLRDTFDIEPHRASKENLQHIINNDPWLQTVVRIELTVGGEKMEVEHIALILRKVKLFQTLPAELLLMVARYFEKYEMIAGDEIFAEGDPADVMYVVVSGEVDLIKGNTLLATKKASELFGELGLLKNDKRYARAIPKTNGILLTLDKIQFNQVLKDIPDVARAVINELISYIDFYTSDATKFL